MNRVSSIYLLLLKTVCLGAEKENVRVLCLVHKICNFSQEKKKKCCALSHLLVPDKYREKIHTAEYFKLSNVFLEKERGKSENTS